MLDAVFPQWNPINVSLCVYGEFAFNLLFVHICRYCIVDIQQCNCILAYNGSDEFTQCSVNINLTGYRDSLCCQTAVYITWNESKLCLECRPAFSCDCHIFSVSSVLLNPVLQGDLILRQLSEGSPVFYFLLRALLPSLLQQPGFSRHLHVCYMPQISQVQSFPQSQHPDIVKLLDRCVARKEIQRTTAQS